MGDGFSRGPYKLDRRIGDMAVVAPDPSVPSSASIKAAEFMLAEPLEMKKRIEAQMEGIKHQMSVMEHTLNVLLQYVLEQKQKTRTSDPPARNYFLNEAHTTHVPKAQLRRERRKAKAKRENESKPVRLRRKTRKSGSRRSRSR